ncbi:(ZYRO0B07216g) [Zygosaccharomyces parabailii]|nr:(ZYRO0B07216g) [Zygosaccharomyces parabailii]
MTEKKLTEVKQERTSIFFDDLGALQKWFDKGFLDANDTANIPRESLSNYSKFEENSKAINPIFGTRKPEITVCHDFKGGYQAGHDLYPNGEYNISSSTPYLLRYPETVDKFIYFTHHCISIPAVCWTNYLHRYHIPVLGTLILEHYSHDGELFKKDDNGDFVYVRLLVELCRIFKFEGWLLNFETGFRNHSELAIPFLRDLTSRVESRIKGGLVIWYDAYTPFANKPSYQNEVNFLNWDAYNNSSQFMTNYMWDSHNVGNSLKNVGVLGMQSKVGLGVDVWGRSMQVCGGGFESNVAISYAKKFGTNAVLFAPAWTYEYFGEEDFIEKDDIFWTKIKETLNYEAQSKSDLSSWYLSESTNTRFFTTFFSTGSGTFFNFNGERVLDDNWVQLSLATPLPIHQRAYINTTDSYVGGTCLTLPLSSMDSGRIPLFEFEQFVSHGQKAANSVLKVKAAFKKIGTLPAASLVIRCFVVRRGRRSQTVLKVKDVSVTLSLGSDVLQDSKWTEIEQTVTLPDLQPRFLEEYFVEGAHLEWTVDDHDEWMVVPEKGEDLEAKLLLGSLCMQVGEPDDIKNKSTARGSPYVCLENKEQTFMWVVLQGGRLHGVHFAPVTDAVNSNLEVFEYNRDGCMSQVHM